MEMNQSNIDSEVVKVVKIATAIALIAVGIVAVVALVVNTVVKPSCTVGVVGTAASITFTDIDINGTSYSSPSQNDCRVMASASQQYYLMTNQSPSGTLLCEGDLTNNSWYSSDLPSDLQPGVHYKVYDTGMFDLVGSQLCHDINEPAPVPTTYGQD
jgi:hypothetical protein